MELLQKPEYVHVLINHLPLTGLFAALVALVAALIIRRPAAIFLALALVCAFSLSAWPVFEYGQAAYDRVYSMADQAGDAYLARHRELAERWVWLFYMTAGAAALALVAGWKRPKWLSPSGVVVAALAAGSLAAGAVIADCGGKVRHREFRTGPPPPLEHVGS